MKINKIIAILKKQLLETSKNKSILIQFILFPVMTVIIANSVQIDDLPPNYFVNLFAIMYVGIAPLVSISTIISEEKECNTLRVLLMSNVKALEYLIGISFYVIALCSLGSLVIGLQGDFSLDELVRFMVIMFSGILVSSLFGAAVGIYSKNQNSAASISVPLMMIFAFTPMISMFNDTVSNFSQFLYTQQLSNLLNNISSSAIDKSALLIIGANALVALVCFILMYRKNGLEN